jgi:hypothetical protein
VAQAGYFNVLRSSGWFSTLRLPGGFRYLIKGPPTPPWLEKLGGAKATPEQQSEAGEAEASLDFGMQKTRDESPLRMVLVALVALAFSFGLIWWFWHIGVRGGGIF